MSNTTIEDSSNPFSYEIVFRRQSQSIQFPSWITLFTVCLAPLIAHLVAGAPKIVYLHRSRPPWHETIVHYNPTSIIWRYFAIVDRRVRAESWTSIDIVSCNALLWTSYGWDGSRAMTSRCRDLCVRYPPPLSERLISKDGLKTTIVTLQGIQVVYLLTYGYHSFAGAALDTIFMPLALFGLLRLPAALWMTDEYVLMDQEEPEASLYEHSISGVTYHSRKVTSRTSYRPLINPLSPGLPYDFTLAQNFDRATSLGGLAVRTLYFSFLLGSLVLCVYSMLPIPHTKNVIPLTVLITQCMYMTLVVATLMVLFIYSLRSRSSSCSTIIPCASTLLYKIYTCILMTTMAVLLVVAALETRKTPCGVYVTASSSWDDHVCPELAIAKAT